MQKYGHDDARPVLERASARETAGPGSRWVRWPGCCCARRSVWRSSVTWSPWARLPRRTGCSRVPRRRRASTRTRCAAQIPKTSAAMVEEIDAVRRDGDTLGGVVEVLAY